MKFRLINIIVLFSLTALLLNFCSSPTEVPANRKINSNGNGNNEIQKISLNESELIFEDVSYGGYKSHDFTVFNNTDASITIENINFKYNNDFFSVFDPEFPIILAPKGESGYSERIHVSFQADELGAFNNILTFNGFDKPTLIIKAFVPTIEVPNLNFGTSSISSQYSKAGALIVRNHGDEKATIISYNIYDPEGVFEFISTLPVELEKGIPAYFYLRFKPRTVKPYNGRIEFRIEGKGIIDNVGELSGTGIM